MTPKTGGKVSLNTRTGWWETKYKEVKEVHIQGNVPVYINGKKVN